ncbi:hypothetical protein FQN50_003608 [Emmonsiellopsis sp. PD_5]|nr:hypothetical protein FQN50_003608 [Emmonsiellopsis sp. PD_5]
MGIFTSAYIRAIGTFQDGGLRENNPVVITQCVSHQIWPTKKVLALVILIRTGTKDDKTSTQEEDKTLGQAVPYFHNVFKDGFPCHALNAWLSSLDGKAKWRDLLNHLSDNKKADHIQFNVLLKGITGTINSVSNINGYHDLVILHPGSVKKTAKVASTLLISAFYLVLATMPDGEEGQFWYWGTIHC